jgi:uncharacterized protein (DUF302 family)
MKAGARSVLALLMCVEPAATEAPVGRSSSTALSGCRRIGRSKVTGVYERLPADAAPDAVVAALRDVLRERGITEYAVVDHGHDMAATGAPAYPAWTLIFGSPAAGAQLLAYDPAAAVDIPLRLAVIGRDGGSEIVLRDMRTLIDADVADGFTAVLRGLAEAARERV